MIAPTNITPEEGVYLHMPFEDYLAIPALSFHGMMDLAISPLNYWHKHRNPNRPERVQSDAMFFGTALHSLLLTPDQHCNSYYRAPQKSDYPGLLETCDDLKEWLANSGLKKTGTKAELIERVRDADENGTVHIWDVIEERFAFENAGKMELSADQQDRLFAIHQIIESDTSLVNLLAHGKSEVTIVVRDDRTGVLLKGRLDYFAPFGTTDPKTFTNSKQKPIKKAICDEIFYRGYLNQAVLYHTLRRAAEDLPTRDDSSDWKSGMDFEDHTFTFLFCESEAPHHVEAFELKPHTDNLHWQEPKRFIERMIDLYDDCQREYGNGCWRGMAEHHVLEDSDIRQLAFA